jgi:chemotaxis protein methyltransferase CheR
MQVRPINDQEFAQFQSMLVRVAGISLSPAKKTLVGGRLAKRLQHCQLATYGDYYALLASGCDTQEQQIALDLLTTYETYIFREAKHFDFLRERFLPERRPGAPLRVWSAACSSGEEPYSIAMLLADRLGENGWQVLASDISSRVLEKARGGHYFMDRTDQIPPDYLARFCLKGVGSQHGTLLVEPRLRAKVDFRQINLNQNLPGVGEFDVIFLRNVMIYFSLDTKRHVVARLLATLKPGGYLIVGHSESLNGVADHLKPVAPSIYRKPLK